mmetsp:Transcript_49324/g.81898  ORF Transcript_49324/g.81898 Transcript_49324/m.81898 type:complete len:284 (-) Transcript_49324:91-942(-)|eukprot:CAMPEP_0119311680 /NCGR_PEP_ID=MMETSP1333-20130426/23407_1 /TAXON_ID=418940 /ORGANISM="Scyphosphaera apsteinii, Strain RCC1455" /LENGTH=283 /DNA_ID=CAMNT_0007316121 /DNA_START=205 /DNA_END=1056 /DNA_ORIENTATION=-
MFVGARTHLARAASFSAPLARQHLFARRRASTFTEEPTADPFSEGGPPQGVAVYGIPTSRVIKVLWVCSELGVHVSHVPVWEQRTAPWYAAINPKMQVPSFKDGALTLHESNTICHYLAAKYSPASMWADGAAAASSGRLLPLDHKAAAVASMWTEYAETTIAPAQNPIFFGRVRKGPIGIPASPTGERRPGCPTNEELLAAVPALKQAWLGFDAALEGKDYVTGDRFSIGDVCAAVQANRFIRHNGFGYAELASEHFPNLTAWFARVSARPAFQEHIAPRFN